ncbi:MAG TPA: hypothetical protein PLQ11_00900 [Beijerinckiaceae bacterium]|nr:hypothetical protein [Beijerinckiaceae bacterium]
MAGSGRQADSLTGVWHGQYAYPLLLEPVQFTATLIESGRQISGSIHETGRRPGQVAQQLKAMLEGAVGGATLRFVKTYLPASDQHQDVIYIGTINAERTEIEGEWIIPGDWSGRFVMIRMRDPAQSVEQRQMIEA